MTFGPDGKPLTVHYMTLSAMLLNELQKQKLEKQVQTQEISRLSAQLKQEKAARKHDIESLRTEFAARLTALAHSTVKVSARDVAAVFER